MQPGLVYSPLDHPPIYSFPFSTSIVIVIANFYSALQTDPQDALQNKTDY